MRKQLGGELSVRKSRIISLRPVLLPSVSVYSAHCMKISGILGLLHALPESKTDPLRSLRKKHLCQIPGHRGGVPRHLLWVRSSQRHRGNGR